MAFVLTLLLLLGTAGQNLKVENSWMRVSGKGMNSALYFEIVNNSDKPDTLYKVTSGLAKMVQMHETFKKGDMMGMREVKQVVIQPHSTFKFEPGAHHVMLINLKEDMPKGYTGKVTLYFKTAGKVELEPKAK